MVADELIASNEIGLLLPMGSPWALLLLCYLFLPPDWSHESGADRWGAMSKLIIEEPDQ